MVAKSRPSIAPAVRRRQAASAQPLGPFFPTLWKKKKKGVWEVEGGLDLRDPAITGSLEKVAGAVAAGGAGRRGAAGLPHARVLSNERKEEARHGQREPFLLRGGRAEEVA